MPAYGIGVSGGGVAAEPEEVGEGGRREAVRIEGIAAIDEPGPESGRGGLLEEGAEERSATGGGMLGHELDETAFAEAAAEGGIERGEAGGPESTGAKFRGGELLG